MSGLIRKIGLPPEDRQELERLGRGPSTADAMINQRGQKRLHVKLLRLFTHIDRWKPRDLDPHPIADCDSTHKYLVVRAWLAKNWRFHNSCQADQQFMNKSDGTILHRLSYGVLRDGSFGGVREPVADIEKHLAHHNAQHRPCRCWADGQAIPVNIQRTRRTLVQA